MRQIGMIVGALSAMLAMVATPDPTTAQTSAGETVPLELVEVVSGAPYGPSSAPEVLVGRIPDRTARVLSLPDDVRIVGSLVYPAYSASAVAGDSVTLNLGVSENARGGTYVTVMHPTGREYSICQHRDRSHMHMPESLIPNLAPPDGTVTLGTGYGGGGDEQSARARIRTDLTVDELVDHYGSQLRDHGWEVQTRTSSQGVAAEVFRVADSEGAAWHGVLLASAPAGESERFLSLHVIRIERSR